MSNVSAHAADGADWRLRMSLGITAGWLLLGFVYISKIVGWTDFVSQQAPALGSFVEGAFAPLAFLWLVVGFFLQQQQLSENTRTIQLQLEEMRRAGAQAEVQTRAIAADELHSRQDTFLHASGLVREQRSMIVGWILTSWSTNPEESLALWRRSTQGEVGAFPMEAIRSCFAGDVAAEELLVGTEIRAGHSQRYMAAFERMLESAIACDRNGMIEDAVLDGPHGRLNRMMKENRPAN